MYRADTKYADIFLSHPDRDEGIEMIAADYQLK